MSKYCPCERRLGVTCKERQEEKFFELWHSRSFKFVVWVIYKKPTKKTSIANIGLYSVKVEVPKSRRGQVGARDSCIQVGWGNVSRSTCLTITAIVAS